MIGMRIPTSQDTSPDSPLSTPNDCNHSNVEPERNAVLRTTELICQDCEATLRIVTDLQEAETSCVTIVVTEKRDGNDKWLKDVALALSELHTVETELFPIAIGGTLLGYRADRIYIDSRIDPANLNEQQREWITGSLACRLGPDGEAAIITVTEGADTTVKPIHRSLTELSTDFPNDQEAETSA